MRSICLYYIITMICVSSCSQQISSNKNKKNRPPQFKDQKKIQLGKSNQQMYQAILDLNYTGIDLALKKGANPNLLMYSTRTLIKETPLTLLIKEFSSKVPASDYLVATKKILSLLINSQAIITASNENGKTPLELVIASGNKELFMQTWGLHSNDNLLKIGATKIITQAILSEQTIPLLALNDKPELFDEINYSKIKLIIENRRLINQEFPLEEIKELILWKEKYDQLKQPLNSIDQIKNAIVKKQMIFASFILNIFQFEQIDFSSLFNGKNILSLFAPLKLGQADKNILLILIKAGVNPDGEDFDTLIPIIEATKNKNYDLIEFLIDHNASEDIVDKDGFSSLRIAIKDIDFNLAKFLILKGANFEYSYQDENGNQLSFSACKNIKKEVKRKRFYTAEQRLELNKIADLMDCS